MANVRKRVECLEQEARFTRWLHFSRFLEGLAVEELEEVAIHWRFPERLPDPLPKGMSKLDGLDRKSLLLLWKQSEREISRIMREQQGRSEDERRYYLQHGHWQSQLDRA